MNPEYFKNPFPGQAIRKVDEWSNNYECFREEVTEHELHRAQIVTSEVRKHRADDPEHINWKKESQGTPYAYAILDEHAWYPGTHKPVLDIDMPCKVIPSSTEGHFHLFIDKELSWEDYCKLMNVMAEVGILEEGYVKASEHRKYSATRLPWIKKGTTPHPADNPSKGETSLREALGDLF